MIANELLAEYVDLRKTKNDITAAMQELSLRIEADLIANKLKSIKTEDGTISATRAKRKKMYVMPNTALEYISSRDDLDVDSFLELNEKKYTNLAETELKMTGELLPGITVDETEYLLVRDVKEK